nr:MAG TPA: hypothetical protein [Caudoviricetes sp.]
MKKKNNRNKTKEVLSNILWFLIFILLLGACFISNDLGKYNHYRELYSEGKVETEYNSFLDFIKNWDGDFED